MLAYTGLIYDPRLRNKQQDPDDGIRIIQANLVLKMKEGNQIQSLKRNLMDKGTD